MWIVKKTYVNIEARTYNAQGLSVTLIPKCIEKLETRPPTFVLKDGVEKEYGKVQ